MEATERLSLPMIIAGQAQKELWHNEALLLLDALVAGAVEEAPRNDPPPAPTAGSCYLVGDSPTGEWTQYPGHLAAYGAGGWRFVAPVVGLTVFVQTTERFATYSVAGWDIGSIRGSKVLIDGDQVIGPRAPAIADPAGGGTIDAEARAVLMQMLAALRSHGLIAE
jgi:hypothetical protein